ncbi:MAG: guanylate kinase [Nitrospirae bacterium GWD2_57_9]|nr:MAG: guanylate kinase [Nitrospirae bacterium GWD2_57_9]OGW47536.1 MAG: guanylate kinase [Nitrospirae bacterium GWC2_57_9]
MKRREGLLFVVSAPSGAGKTTLCRALTDDLENLRHSISYTTRSPRPGETDGRDYYYVTTERFQEMIKAGDFAEWAQVHSNFYGTSRRVLDGMRNEGIDVILDIDTQGAKQIREKYDGKAVFIFIMPPSLEILEERLRNRKSDHESEIRKRMQRARDEMRDYTLYDYVIVNRDFERALVEIRSVIISERCRTRLIDPSWMKGLLS